MNDSYNELDLLRNIHIQDLLQLACKCQSLNKQLWQTLLRLRPNTIIGKLNLIDCSPNDVCVQRT